MREKHAQAGHYATDSNVAVAQRSGVIWLAVKPDVVPAVLTERAHVTSDLRACAQPSNRSRGLSLSARSNVVH